MSKVFTSNVFMTFSQEAMEKFFFTGNTKSFRESISLFSKQDIEASIIASPEIESNLIEFDYGFGEGFNKEYHLSIKLLQTNTLFEAWYLSRSGSDDLANNVIKDVINSEDRKVIENLIKTKKYVQTGNVLYFSFGVGDNLDDWAGPFQAHLTSTNISLGDSGIKEVTLKFAAPPNLFLRNYIESKTQMRLGDSLNRYNFLTKGKNIVYRSQVDMPENKVSNVDNYSLKLINSYISKITDCPTLIVLPNLKKIYDTVHNTTTAPGAGVASLIEEADSLDAKANQAEQLRRVSDAVSPNGRNFGLTWDQIRELREKSASLRRRAETIKNTKIKPEQRTKNTLKEAFSFKVHVHNTDSDNIVVDNTDRVIPVTIDEKIESDYNRNKNKNNTVYTLYLENNSSLIPDSVETLLDPYIPLKSFDVSLSKYSSIPYNQELFVENNIKLLKLWNKYNITNNPLLKPVYVFGDRALISKIVYLSDVKRFSDLEQAISLEEYSSNAATRLFLKYYRIEFFEKFIKSKPSSSFNEEVYRTDDLALDSDAFIEERRNGVPVFRFNTQNPNVISVNISDFPAYRAVYDFGYRKKATTPFINSTDSRYEEFIDSFRKNRQSVLDQVEKAIKSISLTDAKLIDIITPVKTILISNSEFTYSILRDNIDKFNGKYVLPDQKPLEFINDPRVLTYDDLSLLIATAIYKKYNKDKPFVEFDNVQESINYESSVLENLNNLSMDLSIKCLPFFHLSNLEVAGQKHCIFVSNDNKIIGADSITKTSFISGIYRFKGFRHYISSDEIFSEFSLFKEIRSSIENVRESVRILDDIYSRYPNLDPNKKPLVLSDEEKIDLFAGVSRKIIESKTGITIPDWFVDVQTFIPKLLNDYSKVK